MDEYGDRLTFENRAINLIGETAPRRTCMREGDY